MSPSDFLDAFLNALPPKNVRLAAARGLAPLPSGKMFELLVHLTEDPEADVASQAAQTLASWPEEEVLIAVQASGCSSRVLEYYADSDSSQRVLEAIILNSATPARLIELLASKVSGALLESILYNRIRILESPAILDRLRQNPAATPEIQRLVQEIETEFFGEKRKDYSLEEPASAIRSDAETCGAEPELSMEDLSLEGLPLDPEARDSALAERLGKMSVRQKIRMALMGTREARGILIRDPNKEVAHSVLRSPKLTEHEVQAFAALRSVSEDVLREIGSNRGWTRNYAVVHSLVRNPKTPSLISQRLLSHLHSKDLTNLSRDHSVPDLVRRNAQRTLSRRLPDRALQ
jgi:hypothetical protein